MPLPQEDNGDEIVLPWENEAPPQKTDAGLSASDLRTLMGQPSSKDLVAGRDKSHDTNTIRTDAPASPGMAGDASVEPVVSGLKDVGETLVDSGVSAARGVAKAGIETAKFASSAAAVIQPFNRGLSEDINSKLASVEDKLGEPQTVPGRLTQGAAQFVTGMLGAKKFLMLGKAAQYVGKAASNVLSAGTSGAVAMDPYESRLSNFMEEFPSLKNPITDLLASKPDDSEAVGRLKSFVENAGLGAVGEGIVAITKGLRSARALNAEGKPQEAQAAMDAALGEAEQGQVGTPAKAVEKPTAEGVDIADEVIRQINSKYDPVGTAFNPEKFDRDPMVVISEVTKKMPASLFTVEPQQVTKELGQMFGADPGAITQTIKELSGGALDWAKQLYGAKVYMSNLGENIARLGREYNVKVNNGVDASAEKAAMQAMASHMLDFSSQVKAVQKGAARATAAGRIKVEFDDQTLRILGMAQNPEEVASILNGGSVAGKVFKIANEVWINSLLSGVRTHMVNTFSNFINGVALPSERFFGGMFTADRARIAKESLEYGVGAAKAMTDSVKMMARAAYLEAPVLEAGGKVEFGKGIAAETFGLNPEATIGQIVNGVGQFVRLPTRALGAGDEFFKQVTYRAQVYSKAVTEGTEKGLQGQALSDFAENQVKLAFDKNGKAIDPAALKWARENTFTQELPQGSLAASISGAAAKNPWLRLFVPFVRTPYNILMSGSFERAPGLNLLRESYRRDFFGRNGSDAAALARGKMATGMALIGTGAYLAASGNITGYGPTDPNLRKLWLQNNQPYSIKTASGKWISYARVDPLATTVGTVADMMDIYGHFENNETKDLLGAMLLAVSHNVTSKTYLSGIAQGLDVVMSGDDNKVQRYLSHMAASFIPAAAQDAAQLTGNGDEHLRETRELLNALRARVPGFSQDVPAMRNIFGEPVLNPKGVGPTTLNPFSVTKPGPDPVVDEMVKLNHGFSNMDRNIGKIKLSDAQYSEMVSGMQDLRVGGKTLREKLAEVIKSDQYKKLSEGSVDYNGGRVVLLDNVIKAYQDANRSNYLNKHPDLKAAVIQDKKNKRLSLLVPGLAAPENPAEAP